ncbi:hypothetical protein ASD21_20870 [Caulobacter sp. Root1455]|uniref:hypothetical protein n=1 Tax=Caulobacter sp. Root1455 TaxID=1736465 RepID=UPI0006F6AFF8|nr:hypothetical protein [Caulobacter sp. Root1455]KQZ03257.1 hypothetical protein ASD21_20870 [Caulobacter sp. Root1455]
MRDFAFGRAVLAGWDLLRRRPLATLALALVGAAATLAGRVTAVVSSHFAVAALSQPSSLVAANTATTLVDMLAFLLVLSVIAAAVSRGGRARFGGDEVRLFILSLLAFVALGVVLLAVGLGGGVTAVVETNGIWKDVVMFAALALGVILVLALASRLSLAGPMTVQDGRLRFMASWRLTRERQWKIFGVFLVTLLMAGLVGGLGSFLLVMAIAALGLDASLIYDPSLAVALTAVVRSIVLVHVLLQGLLVGLAVILQAAPAALIRQHLIGDPVADQAAVFD